MIDITTLIEALCIGIAIILGFYLTGGMLLGIIYIVLNPQEDEVDLFEVAGVKYYKDKYGRIQPYE